MNENNKKIMFTREQLAKMYEGQDKDYFPQHRDFAKWYRDEYLFVNLGMLEKDEAYKENLEKYKKYWHEQKESFRKLYRGLTFLLPYEGENFDKLHKYKSTNIFIDKKFISATKDLEFAKYMVNQVHKPKLIEYCNEKKLPYYFWDVYLFFNDAAGVYIGNGCEEEVVILNPVYLITDINIPVNTEDLIVEEVHLKPV